MMDINQYYKNNLPEDFLISYKGIYSQNLLEDILAASEAKLLSMNEGTKLRRKVYSILVEILQNIHHHSRVQENCSIIFILSKQKDYYSIVTGNYIATENVEILQNHLDNINTLDKKELKKLYLDKLYNGKISEKGGAGLGMLDIARRSGEKLIYEFYKTNEKTSFFSLKVNILSQRETAALE